ncbi:hypothetical protein BCR44DRAFT_370026 [Catenaria anguillulae PL171]|uniref:Uncharacterized protein n=1 Tax=Catenaria anguillulae PL171 TaxID=765915 RepID=A0A1Y2H769_9FUNG|nr:hypothetical protein BCR44DRAFT_370026 [Catenaria anguillulae PL171]
MGGSGLGAEGRASNRRQDVTDKLFSSGREQSKKQEQVPPIGPTPTGHAQSIKGGKCNDCDTLFSLPRAKSLALSHVYDTHTHNNRPSNSIIHKHNDCPLHAYLLARRVRLALVQVYRLVCGHSARARVCVCRDHGRLGQDLVQARAQEAVVEPALYALLCSALLCSLVLMTRLLFAILQYL